jgi:peptide/nickel transport system permease protein
VARFVAEKLASLAIVLFGASVVIFLVMRALPGDPAIGMLTINATPDMIREMRAAMGLERPLVEQYWLWASAVIMGDFGRSFFFADDVKRLVADRFPVTVHVAIASLVIALLIAVPAAVVAATRQGKLADHLCRLIALAGVSMPVFWQGLLMILAFAVTLGWLPAGGYVWPGEGLSSSMAHVLMPAIVLGTAYAATIARMLRASMLDVLGRDYIAVARALGVPERTVIWNDALRNATIPTLTAAGFSFGYLLAGAVLTEVIFNLPGMGRLLYESIVARDYPLVQALVLLNVALFVGINLAMDVLYAVIDPRVRDAGA